MPLSRRLTDEDGVALVQTALIVPLLVFVLGAVLHLGLFMQARAVTIEAVQQGLSTASALGGGPAEGKQITRDFLDTHAPVSVVSVTATDTGTRVSVGATVRAPALVPGLPRDITIELETLKERWIE